MKLLGVFVPLAAISEVNAKGAKTPFRRRLDKTFGLIKEWKAKNLNAHPHASIKLADKDNQTKFDHKFQRIQKAIIDQYEERLAEIKSECGGTALDECDRYLDCSGVGDRMNVVRGKPDVELSDAFMAFVDDKWKRSVAKVFTSNCGFKAKKIQALGERFVGMNKSFTKWRNQCRRYSGNDCPSHCQVNAKKGTCQNKA